MIEKAYTFLRGSLYYRYRKQHPMRGETLAASDLIGSTGRKEVITGVRQVEQNLIQEKLISTAGVHKYALNLGVKPGFNRFPVLQFPKQPTTLRSLACGQEGNVGSDTVHYSGEKSK
jgi:hypothetical protein